MKNYPWRVIAGSLVGAALLGVTVFPGTGWLVRQQAQVLLFGPASPARIREIGQKTLAHQQQVATAHPENFPLQLALAVRQEATAREPQSTISFSTSTPPASSGNLPALHRLEANYAGQPSLYAAMLRDLSRGAVKLDHRTEQHELDAPSADSRVADNPPAPRPADLAEWERAARAGAKLDPDNAFFPLMHAIDRFAVNRDEEALAEIRHAATLPRYDDYLRDEATGGWSLLEAGQNGEVASLQRVAVSAAVLMPHFTVMRSAGRLAVVQAVRLEQAGNVEGGLAIRQALLRCGARMRTDSKWIIGNLVGEAIAALAQARPGGAPMLPRSSNLTSDERARRRVTVYEGYLTRIGHSEEIAWVEHEEDTRKAIKVITSKGLDKGPSSLANLVSLMALWGLDMALLGNALFLVLFGALATWLVRTRRVQKGERLHPTVAWGMGISVVPLALVNVFLGSADSQAASGILALTLLGGVAGIPFLSRWMRPVQPADTTAKSNACPPALLMAATVATVTLMGSLLLWVSGSIGGYVGSLNTLMGSQTSAGEANAPLARLLSAVVVIGLSLLTWGGLALVSCFRRVPVSVGTVRGFARLALPLAAGVALLYVVVLGVTSVREASARKAVIASAQHEGRACADFAGLNWPSFAP